MELKPSLIIASMAALVRFSSFEEYTTLAGWGIIAAYSLITFHYLSINFLKSPDKPVLFTSVSYSHTDYCRCSLWDNLNHRRSYSLNHQTWNSVPIH